jgi:hypothetical protein
VAESVCPLPVSIADEDLVAHEEPIDRIGQSPRRLRHEPRIRGGRRAHHVNPSAPEIEHEERVVGDQPSSSPDLEVLDKASPSTSSDESHLRRGCIGSAGGQSAAVVRVSASPGSGQDPGLQGRGRREPRDLEDLLLVEGFP